MENKTHKKQRSAGIFGVLPLVWAMGLSAAIPAAVGFWILFTTGPWGIPLFLTYLCLLMMPTAYLISRRENNNRRFLVGEEIYFSENPLLREKALRKKRKEGIPAELQQCLESLRKELPDPEEEKDGKDTPDGKLFTGLRGCEENKAVTKQKLHVTIVSAEE